MQDSTFIKVLEYGEQVGLEGTNEADFLKWAEDEGLIDLTSTESKTASQIASLKQLFSECFKTFLSTEKKDSVRQMYSSDVLRTEYYFRLIEHRELQLNREAAKSANRNAFVAIGISVTAIIVSAVMTWSQLNTSVSLDKFTLQSLIESNVVQRDVNLNPQQMKQILAVLEKAKPENKKISTLPSNEVQHHELINRYFESE